MTLDEFKAWFEGFTEDMDGPPNAKQWKRIKARVKDVDGIVTSYPIFVRHYREPYYQSWHTTCTPTFASNISESADNFTPPAEFTALGKAEARSIAGGTS